MCKEIGTLVDSYGQPIGSVRMVGTESRPMFEVELPHHSLIFHSLDTARYYVRLYGFHIILK